MSRCHANRTGHKAQPRRRGRGRADGRPQPPRLPRRSERRNSAGLIAPVRAAARK
jgi:hypothetical protein